MCWVFSMHAASVERNRYLTQSAQTPDARIQSASQENLWNSNAVLSSLFLCEMHFFTPLTFPRLYTCGWQQEKQNLIVPHYAHFQVHAFILGVYRRMWWSGSKKVNLLACDHTLCWHTAQRQHHFESLGLWPWDEQLCSSLHRLLREISGSLATKCCTVLVSYLLNVSVCSFVLGRLCTVALAETAACSCRPCDQNNELKDTEKRSIRGRLQGKWHLCWFVTMVKVWERDKTSQKTHFQGFRTHFNCPKSCIYLIFVLENKSWSRLRQLWWTLKEEKKKAQASKSRTSLVNILL